MTARTLLADRFHVGVRLGALAWWLVATTVIFLAGTWLFSTLLLASQVWGRWGEQRLVQTWPSGRGVELGDRRLTLHEKGSPQIFDLTRKVNFSRWRFSIKDRRGARVPRGYFCCAIQLMQADGSGGATASLYAFIPPEPAEALKTRYPFYELRPAKDAEPKVIPLGGRDAAFLTAEKARWENGAELDPADFEAVLDHLNAHVPEFAAGPTS
jgi:hypothetical protein